MDPTNKPLVALPPPFIALDGIDNARTVATFARSPSVKIRPNIIHRSADPINITNVGKNQLLGRQIRTITDMRLIREPSLNLDINGVEWLFVPQLEEVSPPVERTYSEIAAELEVYEKTPLKAFIKDYAETLRTNGPAYKNFFTHLRDKPGEPVLVHCSAGKDRTGIVVALLLMVLGVHDDDIVDDYALSSVGLASAMPRLMAEFEARNQAYKDNSVGLKNFLDAFPETMAATLELVREAYGGAENYCQKYMGLGDKDIEQIRKNLLLPLAPPPPQSPLLPPSSLPVVFDGVDNVRVVDTFAQSPSVKIRQGLVYRSADPIRITRTGKTQLLGCGIQTVTDMRLHREPGLDLNINGVKWLSVSKEGDSHEGLTYADIAEMLEAYETDPVHAFIVDYSETLRTNGPAYKNFFTHLRDKPGEPVLVHCSAGKDRTGIVITLLLMVLGVHDDDIINEYALSSVGLASAMPRMTAEFEARNQAYKDNPVGLKNFLGAFPETMTATLALVRGVFGGVENYCKKYMGMESSDLGKIRQNLLLPLPLPPPFISLDGVDNAREVGIFSQHSSVKIKPGLIHRSADPINMTNAGKKELVGRRIRTITDMRLNREPDLKLNIEGVEWLFVPQDASPSVKQTDLEIVAELEEYEKSPLTAFIKAYDEILQTNGSAFKNFFTHLRDKPNQPVLVHCSAGKDRTGTAVALLLMVLGVHYHSIVKDYALSRVGLESAMPRLMAEFEARNQAYKDNPVGLKNFLGAFPETMSATLALIREKYDGVENYCKNYMQLEPKDLDKIRQNLLLGVPRPAKSGYGHHAM